MSPKEYVWTNPPSIELLQTQQFYIFVKGEYSLWWNRRTGEFLAKTGWDLASAVEPQCLGICFGIIGKVQLDSVLEPRLILIKEFDGAGEYIDGHFIFKVKSIAFLHLGENNLLNLTSCKKHQNMSYHKQGYFSDQKSTFSKTMGVVKLATNSLKSTTQKAVTWTIPQVRFKLISKEKEKFEKRILDELHKIFTDTDSFYFSPTVDITNTLQRSNKTERYDENLWSGVDDRFFWNKFMLQELMEKNDPLCNPWILPLIQGFVQVENCKIENCYDFKRNRNSEPTHEYFRLILISRRSRHRAGTRYKRRGVDEDGHCANYVETEQLLIYQHHKVSFVQIRGSVPVYWSQPGYKYRPPPRLDRGAAETQVVFEKHFKREMAIYGPICIVNLVEHSGREKIIWDAYTDHILAFNNPDITYASFDFHEYCRGMHFENVSYLTMSLEDIIRDMSYSWCDKQGVICSQKGVFRVNCIDCLDRTNVVQTALAKSVMEIQLRKLGLIIPEDHIPESIKSKFQILWANNGDIISRQYAGTNALKGDYTRTGERKLTGLVKDGMNSANRYYLSRFKDAYRQATMDLMLGNEVTEDLFISDQKQDEDDGRATIEHVKLLIEDSKKLLINNPDLIVGSWGLIDADPVTGDLTEDEMDTILILTKEAYYVAEYDEQIDRVTKYQRVKLNDLKCIELGPIANSAQMPKVFKPYRANVTNHFCIRLNYSVSGEEGYFHMFRSTNLRFFNNMAVIIKSPEEILESLKIICETFLAAIEIADLPPIMYIQGRPLEKRYSKILNLGNACRVGSYLDLGLTQGLTRNISETQLTSFKSVGSKALTNITQQFSKINKLGQSFRRSKASTLSSNLHPLTPLLWVDPVDSDKISLSSSRRFSNKSEDICDITLLKLSSTVRLKHIHHPTVGILMASGAHMAEVLKSDDCAAPSIEKFSLSTPPDASRNRNLAFHSSIDTLFENDTQPKYCSVSRNAAYDDTDKLTIPNKLQGNRKLSASANEIEDESKKKVNVIPNFVLTLDKRCASEKNLNISISSSQSENALRSVKCNITSVITSPVSVTKDMLSPFSKFARSMHILGSNFDPRKFKIHQNFEPTYRISETHLDEIKQLKEKWNNSQTKLIAL